MSDPIRHAIRARLDDTGETIGALAARAGWTRAQLSTYLAGKRDPHVSGVLRLAEAAGVVVEARVNDIGRIKQDQGSP